MLIRPKKLGDDTAYLQGGRVTLNRSSTLDPVGAVWAMLLFGVRMGGRAVPHFHVNFRNPKQDSAIDRRDHGGPCPTSSRWPAFSAPDIRPCIPRFYGNRTGLCSCSPVLRRLPQPAYCSCSTCCPSRRWTDRASSRSFCLTVGITSLFKYERVMFAVLIVLMFIGVFSPVIRFGGGVLLRYFLIRLCCLANGSHAPFCGYRGAAYGKPVFKLEVFEVRLTCCSSSFQTQNPIFTIYRSPLCSTGIWRARGN